MPFDYNSFLQGVQTGLRLGRTTPGRQPPFPPVPSGRYILTESGLYTVVEKLGEGVPIGTATSEVGCAWEQPLTLYKSAYQTYRGSKTTILAYDGCAMLVRHSTDRRIEFAIASDHPGEVGKKTESGREEVYTTYRQYTLSGRTVYYTVQIVALFNATWDDFAPSIPYSEPDFDGRECWIAVFGDIVYGDPMITEGD